MADIKQITLPNKTTYNLKDGSAVANITRSGSTFTATRRDGTTFTFDQAVSSITVDTALSDTSTNPVQNKIITSAIGAAGGIASLDSNGKVPSTQLPSYVDDVLEYAGTTKFPTTGETGKIYVDTSTNKTYRWSGTAYVEISASLALGTTSGTAYRGDYGQTAYTHATDSSRLTTTKSAGLYKVGVTAEGHVSALTSITKADITGLGIPGQDTTYSSKAAASGGTDVSLVTTGEKYTWNQKTSNTGTVTKVSTGAGLTGGDITGTGTVKANLLSETKLTNAAAAATETSNRVYPVALDKDGKLAVNVPWTDSNTTYSSKAAASGGTDVSLVTTGEKYTWNQKTSNTGTVTSVATGAGLTGGTITGSGTIKANLLSETKLTNAAASATEVSGRVYPVALDKNGKLAVNVPWSDTNTTYSSKTAASGGTDVSLVTTGEKYTWNNKSNLTIGTTATTAAAGNHTHSLSLATSTGTSQITLASSTKYQLTAGGSTYVFTTPASPTDVVVVSTTQPTSTTAKIWINA